MDNASGVAIMLAVARQLAEAQTKPRRPILFAAVTAEEKGLLGSRHLSHHPLPGGRFAANVNIDMGLFFGPLRGAIGFGREHTTQGPLLEEMAGRLNWTVHPVPNPAQRIFGRSDRYSFVREGVSSIYLDAADQSADPAVDLGASNREFMRTRYHRQNDDL